MKKKQQINRLEKTVGRLIAEIIYHLCISDKPSGEDEVSTYKEIFQRAKLKTPEEVDAVIIEAVRRINILFPTTINLDNKEELLIHIARARTLIIERNEENKENSCVFKVGCTEEATKQDPNACTAE